MDEGKSSSHYVQALGVNMHDEIFVNEINLDIFYQEHNQEKHLLHKKH